jgi:hypothetical protein
MIEHVFPQTGPSRSRSRNSDYEEPSVIGEAPVRDQLREHLARNVGPEQTIDEFWVPRSHERADLVAIKDTMDGFEIKSHRDTLRRLPRQIEAYGRLFDRCTLVLAERHVAAATEMLPSWWGVVSVHVNGGVVFEPIRAPSRNPRIDPEILVRLLWREEVDIALRTQGERPVAGSSRQRLWSRLLRITTTEQLRTIVRRAILMRDPAAARIPTRRFAVLRSS